MSYAPVSLGVNAGSVKYNDEGQPYWSPEENEVMDDKSDPNYSQGRSKDQSGQYGGYGEQPWKENWSVKGMRRGDISGRLGMYGNYLGGAVGKAFGEAYGGALFDAVDVYMKEITAAIPGIRDLDDFISRPGEWLSTWFGIGECYSYAPLFAQEVKAIFRDPLRAMASSILEQKTLLENGRGGRDPGLGRYIPWPIPHVYTLYSDAALKNVAGYTTNGSLVVTPNDPKQGPALTGAQFDENERLLFQKTLSDPYVISQTAGQRDIEINKVKAMILMRAIPRIKKAGAPWPIGLSWDWPCRPSEEQKQDKQNYFDRVIRDRYLVHAMSAALQVAADLGAYAVREKAATIAMNQAIAAANAVKAKLAAANATKGAAISKQIERDRALAAEAKAAKQVAIEKKAKITLANREAQRKTESGVSAGKKIVIGAIFGAALLVVAKKMKDNRSKRKT